MGDRRCKIVTSAPPNPFNLWAETPLEFVSCDANNLSLDKDEENMPEPTLIKRIVP